MDKQKTWVAIVSIVSALFGGAIGATVTYYTKLDIEERKLSFEERKNGYAEFFEGTVLYWQAGATKDQAIVAEASGDSSEAKKLEYKADSLYAKYKLLHRKARFKIGVFSDATVIQKIVKYLQTHFQKEPCINYQKFKDDVAIYQAIRDEMKAKGHVKDKDLALVLFNCKLEE